MGAIRLVLATLSYELVCQIAVVLLPSKKHRSKCFWWCKIPRCRSHQKWLCTVTTDLGVSVLPDDFFLEPEQKTRKFQVFSVPPCGGNPFFPRQLSRSCINGPRASVGMSTNPRFTIESPKAGILRRFRSCHFASLLDLSGVQRPSKILGESDLFAGSESQYHFHRPPPPPPHRRRLLFRYHRISPHPLSLRMYVKSSQSHAATTVVSWWINKMSPLDMFVSLLDFSVQARRRSKSMIHW